MQAPKHLRSRNRGVTLVELMVGLTIGMLLVVIASAVYLYSKKTYNVVSENAQMEENGRFALNLLTKYIQSAGFAMVDPAASSAQLPLVDKIAGCDYGYVNAGAATTLSDLACRTATPTGELRSASFSTRFETDAPASGSGKQQGFGCTNEAAASKHVTVPDAFQTYEAHSYFFVSRVNVQTPYGTTQMGQLSCVADSTPYVDGVPGTLALRIQPLVPGIEQIALNYISSTGAVTALPTTEDQWKDITAVELCVVSRTIQAAGRDGAKTYTDCFGSDITANESESYRTLRTTVALRNIT